MLKSNIDIYNTSLIDQSLVYKAQEMFVEERDQFIERKIKELQELHKEFTDFVRDQAEGLKTLNVFDAKPIALTKEMTPALDVKFFSHDYGGHNPYDLGTITNFSKIKIGAPVMMIKRDDRAALDAINKKLEDIYEKLYDMKYGYELSNEGLTSMIVNNDPKTIKEEFINKLDSLSDKEWENPKKIASNRRSFGIVKEWIEFAHERGVYFGEYASPKEIDEFLQHGGNILSDDAARAIVQYIREENKTDGFAKYFEQDNGKELFMKVMEQGEGQPIMLARALMFDKNIDYKEDILKITKSYVDNFDVKRYPFKDDIYKDFYNFDISEYQKVFEKIKQREEMEAAEAAKAATEVTEQTKSTQPTTDIPHEEEKTKQPTLEDNLRNWMEQYSKNPDQMEESPYDVLKKYIDTSIEQQASHNGHGINRDVIDQFCAEIGVNGKIAEIFIEDAQSQFQKEMEEEIGQIQEDVTIKQENLGENNEEEETLVC